MAEAIEGIFIALSAFEVNQNNEIRIPVQFLVKVIWNNHGILIVTSVSILMPLSIDR